MAPIAPEQYKIQMTVSRDTYGKLRRAQDLIRHMVPNADPAAIFERALTLFFVGRNGRCTERAFLEFHHVLPHAAAGKTSVGHLQLRCRTHNVYEAELFFGPLLMQECGKAFNSVQTDST
jgi:hypothetical protein